MDPGGMDPGGMGGGGRLEGAGGGTGGGGSGADVGSILPANHKDKGQNKSQHTEESGVALKSRKNCVFDQKKKRLYAFRPGLSV